MGRIQHSMLKTNISKTSKNLLGIVFFFAPFFISFYEIFTPVPSEFCLSYNARIFYPK